MSEQTIYAWQEQEDSGEWGTVCAVLPILQAMALVSRSRKVADAMKPLAEKHAKEHHRIVALRKYIYEETIENIDAI